MRNTELINYNLDDDIKKAQAVIDGRLTNDSFEFNNYSPIYKSTNECLSHPPYMDALKNKERVLGIIGSGDQLINTILFGSSDIVGIDISTFPKYFFMLKLAAIKLLEKNDYLEYFYGITKEPFQDGYYEIIRNELDNNVKRFWDFLYNNCDNLYHSHLFNSFDVSARRAIINNPFLQDNYYYILKRNLENLKIQLLKYDMFNANKLDKKNFDLILLSNIINNQMVASGERIGVSKYNERFLQSMKKYKKFLKTLPLNKNGIALTYNFSFNGSIVDLFKEKEYKVYRVKEDTKLFNCENEILIYKKSKH